MKQIKPDTKFYEELLTLASANVSGAVGRQLVTKAQHQLVTSLVEKGLVDQEDAAYLKM